MVRKITSGETALKENTYKLTLIKTLKN